MRSYSHRSRGIPTPVLAAPAIHSVVRTRGACRLLKSLSLKTMRLTIILVQLGQTRGLVPSGKEYGCLSSEIPIFPAHLESCVLSVPRQLS